MAEQANNYHGPEDGKKNSDPNRPPIQKVIKGEVKTRKKPLYQRVIEYFSGDDMQSVGQYVLFDVILPAFKSLIFDAASQGLERRLFGTERPRSGHSRGWIPYNRTPQAITVVSSGNKSNQSRGPIEKPLEMFQDIIVTSRADAQEILDAMENYIEQYVVVTIADLYEMIGQKEAATFTDTQWGWRTTTGCSIRPQSNGYLLILTRPEQLDR